MAKEAEIKKTEMAEDLEEYIPYRLFRDNDKYKNDVFVAVNGEACQIKRGEQVMIKRKFAKVLEQSYNQDMEAARVSGELEENSRFDSR